MQVIQIYSEQNLYLNNVLTDSEPYTVSHSQSQLIHLVSPSDCVQSGFCRGGVILKMMDECAGMVAAKHCKTNIVTASLDATNFHQKVPKGRVCELTKGLNHKTTCGNLTRV